MLQNNVKHSLSFRNNLPTIVNNHNVTIYYFFLYIITACLEN